jgi:uncharacterized protein (TIGR02996 family)
VTDGDRLYAAVLAAPEDVTLRLVYAEALDKNRRLPTNPGGLPINRGSLRQSSQASCRRESEVSLAHKPGTAFAVDPWW